MKLRVGLTILATMVLGGMLLSGVVLAKNKTGDSNPNTLMGTNSTDYIRGKGGGDDIGGKRSRDYLWGNLGNDLLHGGAGNDRVHGDKGDNDVVYGDAGNDKLWGEIEHKGSFQAAKVKGGRKPDKLLGGRGNDTIRARDGNRDIIRGGPGYDKAYVDRVDKVTGVEKEVVPGGGGGPGGPQPKKQCADGRDNDGDGKTDRQDPGCASAADNTESPDPPPKQCADGEDNDGDGKIDSQDSGCASATDDTENTPPVAKKDTATTIDECNSVDIDVIANDKDADGDPLSVSSFTQPSNSNGEVTENNDGTLEYTPEPECPGTDSFTYKATDGVADSNVAKVKITIGPPIP
jgi:Ca2+-binding RTX toxin-like protein